MELFAALPTLPGRRRQEMEGQGRGGWRKAKGGRESKGDGRKMIRERILGLRTLGRGDRVRGREKEAGGKE